MIRRAIALVAFGCLASACASAGRTATWDKQTADNAGGTATSTSVTAGLWTKGLEHWNQRDDQAQIQEAITVWEQLVEKDPKHTQALVMLARAHYFLADGFLALQAEDNEAIAKQEFSTYEKGTNYGERALVILEPKFGEMMRAEAKFEDAIKTIGEKGVPAAYWYAVNLGRFASKKGIQQRLFYKDKLRATMERVLEASPTYFHGAPDRYLGAYFSLLPGIAGRDLDRSAKHFAKSLELAPNYLGTKVVQAQFHSTASDNEEAYKKLLNEVIAASAGENPDIAPENRAAQRTAKRMLENIDDVF